MSDTLPVHVDATPMPLARPLSEQTAGEMTDYLAQEDEKREVLLKWCREHLKPGIHYGYPPGCEPETDERGYVKVKGKWIPQWQYTYKPGLLKAGGPLIADLFKVTGRFAPDEVLMAQLNKEQPGKVAQTLYLPVKCELVGVDGRVWAQGAGIAFVGEKQWDANQAYKQSCKRAFNDAALRLPIVCDLFGDEDFIKAAREAPEQDPSAPIAPTRNERTSEEQVKEIEREYREITGTTKGIFDFMASAVGTSPAELRERKASDYNADMITLIREELAKKRKAKEEGGDGL